MEHTPRDRLHSVFAELQGQLCHAVGEHCGKHTRDIESHAVSIIMADEAEMAMKVIDLKKGDIWFSEYGCTVCDLGPQGCKLTDCVKSTTGSGVQIEYEDCQGAKQGESIGTFHTHPYGEPAPSYTDIMNFFIDDRKVSFVGGMVGDQRVVFGYAARPDSMMKWEMRQRIEPYRDITPTATEFVVQFDFRLPDATDPNDTDIMRYDVFSDEKQMKNFLHSVEYLKNIFDVVVHWC